MLISPILKFKRYRLQHLAHADNSAVAQCINSACGPDVINFMTEAAGRMKIDRGPHWVPGPDFGHF